MERLAFCLLYLIAVTLGCSSPKSSVKPSVVNLSNMYNPGNTKFHPAYTVYHNGPGSSLLLIKIFPSELLYSGTIQPDRLIGQVSITWTLTDITDPHKDAIADSGKINYSFARENADKRFQTQIPFKTETGKRYQMTITARDLVRKADNLTYLYVDRTSEQSEQNFMIYAAEDHAPFYKPYVVGNHIFKIDYNLEKDDSVYVKYYSREIPLPKPSFSLSREMDFFGKPDSLWILPLNKAIFYQLNYEGVYLFQPDTNLQAGLTLMNFGESFPKVDEVKQLIEPLAYLATSAEYNDIKKATNQKLAVDNFWLEKTGNMEKARELIRVYYNRVYFANYYFTSFKAGWKTDRGMIFIIYGPPQSVKVSPDQEKWVYYKNNYTTTVTFTFNNQPTPYSIENYILERSDNYDTFWRTAVDTWRKGNIYLIE